MADESTQQTEQQGQPPIDMDALKAMMQDSVRDTITKLAEEQKSQYVEQPPVEPNRPGADPLGDMIRPYIEPRVNAAILEAQSAADLATFYQSNPQAGKYRDEIETRFQNLKSRGTPFTRNDIWKWYRGENFDKFATEQAEEQKRQAEESARIAAGVGPGSPFRGEGGPAKDAFTMPHEELTKALEGQSF